LDIKEILYNSIDKHAQYIVSDIAQGKSSDVIDAICKECISEFEKIEGGKSEMLGTFAEGLIHYLLTMAMIPSQRKTTFNDTYVDIAIPDTMTLSSSPQEVLIIAFPKTNDALTIKSRISELLKIQPNKENIWLVLENEPRLETKVYSIRQDGRNSFSNIINETIHFLTSKKQSKLKLFRIQET
jgi:hypothetical protein